jgi:hypothetical protein
MRQPIKTPWPSAAAWWSLLWRAVVLTPFAAVFGVVWAMTWPLLILGLPVGEVYFLSGRQWLGAALVPAIWVLFFRFARSRWFKADRTDFLNDQENV